MAVMKHHKDKQTSICERLAIYYDKMQYQPISWRKRLRVYGHLLLCKACKKYAKRSAKLTRLMQQLPHQKLSAKDLDYLKSKLQANNTIAPTGTATTKK